METEEDIDAWYEEKKQQLMVNLTKAIENKKDVDAAEATYTKDFGKLFEEYSLKKSRIAESILVQGSENTGFLDSIKKKFKR
jgi:hypothetical protein